MNCELQAINMLYYLICMLEKSKKENANRFIVRIQQ